MVQHAILPPLTRGQWFPMTWEEFLVWSPDEGQSEWVDGEGIAYVSNSTRHVRLVFFLAELLGRYLRYFDLGEIFGDTMLLRLPERPSGRMPDLFVVGKSDLHRIQTQWVDGPALLAVEIISEESVRRDTHEKRAEYAQAGVLEYLTIDARPGQDEVTFLNLDGEGRYQSITPDAHGRLHSAALPGFWLDPAWFRLDSVPEVDDLLLQIAPEAYEAWLLAKIRSRRAAGDTP
jgi:Uma2 family endonuclease